MLSIRSDIDLQHKSWTKCSFFLIPLSYTGQQNWWTHRRMATIAGFLDAPHRVSTTQSKLASPSSGKEGRGQFVAKQRTEQSRQQQAAAAATLRVGGVGQVARMASVKDRSPWRTVRQTAWTRMQIPYVVVGGGSCCVSLRLESAGQSPARVVCRRSPFIAGRTVRVDCVYIC